MASDQDIIRELWERSSDEEIVRALFVAPDEYNAEAIEILAAIAKRRGLDPPDQALVERLRKEFRARESAEDAGKQVVVCGDKTLVCCACGNDAFRQRGGSLNSALANMLGLEGSDRAPRCLICTRCGYIHWFA
jgi:hypothetical protein